jgi:deoxyguanosine kinase
MIRSWLPDRRNKKMRYNYIAIEGNIGAGKTSLASMIAAEFNGKLILEQFEDNSFLPKFYKEPEKYAFPLEMSFLAERYQQLKDQLTKQDLFKTFTISDYLFNKSLIFARNNLQTDEFALFSRMFGIINEFLPKPDLLVYLYLDISKLQQNIRRRGRSYEQAIRDSYLENIQTGYFDHIRKLNNMRVLVIDTNNIDFVNERAHYEAITNLMWQPHEYGIHRFSL